MSGRRVRAVHSGRMLPDALVSFGREELTKVPFLPITVTICKSSGRRASMVRIKIDLVFIKYVCSKIHGARTAPHSICGRRLQSTSKLLGASRQIRTCFFFVDVKSRPLGSPDTTSRMSKLRDGSSARPKKTVKDTRCAMKVHHHASSAS